MSVLTVQTVSKRYGNVQALEDVSLDFRSGEIHAVLGENGAGKSTLVSVLSGFVTPDSGRMQLDGTPLPFGKPFESKRLGIEMIHQHFTLVPQFSVAENLALGRLGSLKGALKLKALSEPGLALAQQLNWAMDPQASAGSLTVGAQQRLEIVKAIGGNAHTLIFDEPTAVLSGDEVEDLFRVLRSLKESGKRVILIAHKLSEVLAIADRVTVLRRGKLVASRPIEEVSANQLAEWMVGEMPPIPENRPRTSAERVGLEARDLFVEGSRGEESVRGVSFQIHRGEILGLGGVDGNGQIELAEAVAGVRPVSRGALTFEGRDLSTSDTTIGYIPQDRQGDGLAMGMSVQDNLMIVGYRRPDIVRGPWLSQRAAYRWAESLIHRFQIKVESPRAQIAGLSGGNQQKVVVSRTLDETPGLLVAVNPTRGLDIKATSYVHGKLREAAEQGAAVLLVSGDLDELSEISDRIFFMNRGALFAAGDASSLVGGQG